MKNLRTFEQFDDFIGQQAEILGMTREEYVAHYATPTIGAGIDEKKADGTISDDEDEMRDSLMANVEAEMETLVSKIKSEANTIGGSFRSPGIEADALDVIKAVLKRHKFRI